jgi:non-ribosomal peptide synthetase component F
MLEALDPANRMVMAHSAAWTLTGALDASLLEMALRDVIARHGSLRTRFEEIDGALQQVIEPDVPFALHRHDLRHLSGAPLEAEVARRFAHFHDRPFDLAAPPLFRALLIQVGAAEHRFYTMQHVLIWDGWSFDLFLADLAAAYTGRRAGHAPAWEPLPISYADYAIWQQEQLQSAAMESRRGWWDAHLAGELPVVELPTDRPRPAQSSYAGDRITMRLTGADVEAVRRAAQREGVTLFQYLFTAFQVLLHRYSGQRDLMIGIPLRNRSRSEVEGVIGSFVNTVAIRSQVDPEMPFAELLTQVKQSCVAALEHQDVPFELLDRRAPAVRVLFSMQDARERPPALDDCRIEQFTLAEHTAANDLMLWTMEYPSSLLIVLSYRTDLFDAETAQAMVEQFVSVVRDAERAPRTPLADFALAAGGRSMPRRLPEPEPAWFSTPTAWSRALTAIGMRKGDTVVVRCRADADRVALTRAAFAASVTVAHLAHDDSDGYTRTVLEQVGARLLVSDEPLAECPIAQVSPAALGDAAVSLPADAMAPPTVAALTIITADAPLPHVQQVTPTQVTTHVAALAQALRLGDSDVMLDASVSGSGQLPIFALAAASVGATRVGIDSEPAHDGASLVALLEATPCSIMVLPGSAVRGLAAVDWTGRASLRVILTSTCSADDTQWLATRVSELALAEYAVGVAGPVALTALPVGSTVVLDGIAPAVVGESGGDQPVGVPGVVQWTALTTAITGWSARRRRDGRVVLGTRPVDDLVIGDRAWDRAALGRVMAAALGATEATLAVHHDAAGAARLVGYLVSARDASDSERRRQLRSVLPARAIPPFFVPLDSLPITARGALDLTALPNPYGSRVPLAQRAAPATDDERLLAALWCEMLGVTTVARHDNFFALGGYSLLAFQLLDRVEESTGRRLNPRGLLFGTLEQVAATLAATAPTVPVSSAAAPVAARSRGVLSRWRRWIGAENSGHPSGTAGERPE